MGNYKDLSVWNKAMELTIEVYKITSKLPKYEQFALADQLRRASVSVPSNIAEGQKRGGVKEVVHFSSIALGSLAEVETQLILAHRIYGIDTTYQLQLASEVGRMLSGLARTLRSKE